jgi:hypothetical protein
MSWMKHLTTRRNRSRTRRLALEPMESRRLLTTAAVGAVDAEATTAGADAPVECQVEVAPSAVASDPMQSGLVALATSAPVTTTELVPYLVDIVVAERDFDTLAPTRGPYPPSGAGNNAHDGWVDIVSFPAAAAPELVVAPSDPTADTPAPTIGPHPPPSSGAGCDPFLSQIDLFSAGGR